ncbi:hypothetical protein MMC13_001278 [Lambiella insularis]|nr:hypothetical protein [Lambiella insularis]
MPHPVLSRSSDEGLSRKSWHIDDSKIAARTSSVRLKRQARPSIPHIHKLKRRSGHHSTSISECFDRKDNGCRAEQPHTPRRSIARKPLQPSWSSLEEAITEVIRNVEGYQAQEISNSQHANQYTSIEEISTDANDVLQEAWSPPKSHRGRQGAVVEASLTSSDQKARQDTAQTHTFPPDGFIHGKIQEEQRAEDDWRMIRKALQVEIDDIQLDLCSKENPRPSKAWRHSGSNFFPAGCRNMDQDTVIERVQDFISKAKNPFKQ